MKQKIQVRTIHIFIIFDLNILFCQISNSNVYKILCVICMFYIFVLMLKKGKTNISYNFQNLKQKHAYR